MTTHPHRRATPGKRIGWWADSRDLRVAGVRIRVHLVMRALRARGVAVDWAEPGRSAGYDTIVVHKSCGDRAQEQVRRWQVGGARIVFDLCDNLFHYPNSPVKGERRSQKLKRMIALADTVVASTPTLAQVVVEACPGVAAPVVIGDPVDDLSVVPVSWLDRLLMPRRTALAVRRLEHLQARGHLRLLWFGNHGSGYADAGMAHLAALRETLESLHRHTPLSLTVISNHRRRFREHFRGWSLPCDYQPWHPLSFNAIASHHDIALIPIQDNPFTRCKSDNRLVTAMARGLAVAVAADDLPSYRPYASVAQIEGVVNGLRAYLADPALRARNATQGQALVRQSAGIEPVADRWQALLQDG